MKTAIIAFIILQFAHVPLGDAGGNVFDFSQLLSVLLLLRIIYKKTPFKEHGEKRCFLALIIWLSVSFVMNVMDAAQCCFTAADSVLVVFVIRQLLVRPIVRASDEYNTKDVFYLLSSPKEIGGLLLSTFWLPFGNRMVVHNESIYHVRRWRFVKRPFKKSQLNGRLLLNTSLNMDPRLENLTDRIAIPLFHDCREYEKLFGRIRNLLKIK